jgi:hypothetical protein
VTRVRRTDVNSHNHHVRARSCAVALALTIATTGMLSSCGTSTGPVTVTSTGSPSSSAGAAVGDELAGDLGYFRAGGIAGFADQLTVSKDGVAVLQRHGKEVVRCKVKPAPLAQLARLQSVAVKSVPSPTAGPRNMPPAHADMMTVGLVVAGTRVPSKSLSSTPPEWQQLFEQMSTLFEETVALGPGATATPNASASMCDPI